MIIKSILLVSVNLITVHAIFAQYTYFNNAYLDTPEEDAAVSSIFVDGLNYVQFNLVDLNNIYQWQFRKLDQYGDVEEDINIPLPDSGYYIGSPSAFQEYSNGLAWAGSLVTSNESNTGTAIWFHPETYHPQWIHFFNDLIDEQTTSPMSCLRKLSDGSFMVGGNLWHYFDEGPSVDEFSTYLAFLNDQGGVIEQWVFDEGNEFYRIQQIIELDNGKLLLSGMLSNSEINNHFLKLFNPVSGEFEEELILGSQWNEANSLLREMPNGNFYLIYDNILESDGEIVLAEQLIECRIGQIDPNSLEFISDIQLPIEDLQETIYGFGIVGFEFTPDGGYVFCYNLVPLEMGDGYSHPHLVKLDENFEIEWVKEYSFPPIEYQNKGIRDIMVTPDGGFVCTGTALVPNPGEFQRQWTFKTDACGDLENLGCPTSVNELTSENSKLIIAPNPANKVASISSEQPFQLITISDLAGRMVFSQNHNNRLFAQINLEHLAKGAYLVEVKFDSGEVGTSKLIIE